MGRFTDAYSRIVAAAKILLPLLALGVMSLLFLVSRPTQQDEPLPLGDGTVVDLAREQRLGAPTFSGVTSSGMQVVLSADSVRPDPERSSLIHTAAPVGRVLTPDGVEYRLTADRGEIDEDQRITSFHDGVSVETSDGYVLTTPSMTVASDMSRLTAPNDVRIIGPAGHLRAGSMEITQNPETGTDTRLVFTGGVNLLYSPQS